MQAQFSAAKVAEEEHKSEADADIQTLQNELIGEAKPEEGTAEQSKHDDDTLLNELLKQAESSTLVDAEVDPRVASIVNALFRKKMNKETFREMTSDILTARPKNCEGLSMVQTNSLLWAQFSDRTKIQDKRLQNQQKALVSASAIITKLFDKLVAAKGNPNNLQIPEMLSHANKSLMLLGDINFNMNMFRRNLMKPELKENYKKLCSESVPFTSELFGEDLAKLAKEIGETAKISHQMKAANNFKQSGARGRGTDYRRRYEPYYNPRSQPRRSDHQQSSARGSGSYKKNFFPKRSQDKNKP